MEPLLEVKNITKRFGGLTDAGQIFFEGRRIKISNPIEALKIGIETIYQDLALAENMNVYSI